MTKTNHRRSAFTLVEMLVAAALIIFMMYVIASAFEKGLESFRILKAQGDMNEKLRAAASALRLDLSTPHFGGAMSPDNQGPFLSDQRLNNQYWQPPQKGYFRISLPGVNPARQNGGPPAAGIQQEGVDPDNPNAVYYRPDYRPAATPPICTSRDLYLQFTVNLTDGHPTVRDARGRRDQFNQTDIYDGDQMGLAGDGALNPYSQPEYNRGDMSLHPGYTSSGSGTPKNTQYSTLFTSTWAEVTYYAMPNGRTTTDGVPLFDFYRRQKLLVEPAPPNPYPVSLPSDAAGNALGMYADVSLWQALVPTSATNNVPVNVFNGAAHVTEPQRRWGMLPPQGTVSYPFGQPAAGLNPANIQPVTRFMDEPVNGVNNNGVKAGAVLGLSNSRAGGDLLLTDVANVEVKALWEPVRVGAPNTDRFTTTVQGAINPDFVEPSPRNNPDYPFDWLPQGINPGINAEYSGQIPPPVVFDTWSCNTDTPVPGGQTYNYGPAVTANNATTPVGNTVMQQELGIWNVGHFNPIAGLTPVTGNQQNPYVPTQYTIPLRVRVRALQIKIRIWDQKSNQTRQITIIQDV
jgi:type II secretory pathway pseudopilin PulG